MLYSRFGDKVSLVRLATVADVKTFENRKADKEDRRRTGEGWRAIALFSDNKERLVDAAFLRADDGWAEVHKAFVAIGGGSYSKEI